MSSPNECDSVSKKEKLMDIPAGKAAIVLGAQWGDEGKGKIVDLLADKADIVARCQGGNNAGHTVVVGENVYDFHLLPSGIIRKNAVSVIGNGVVLNLPALFGEIEKNRIDQEADWNKRLVVSEECHLVFKFHLEIDKALEDADGQKGKLGTTRKGIGPAYASKMYRKSLRVSDLVHGDFDSDFAAKFLALVEFYKTAFPNIEVDVTSELSEYRRLRDKLLTLNIVTDVAEMLEEGSRAGKRLLVEGANGALLDVDFGTYPFVTSSNCSVGGAITGLGLSLKSVDAVIGVVKAYQTRVGSGPFPTELADADGDYLQKTGHEFGVTTGRPRRCGWLDLVMLRRSCTVNHYDWLALTKVDVLDDLDRLKVCVAYKKSDGTETNKVPLRCEDLERVTPVYRELAGWKAKSAGAKCFDELPENLKSYVRLIEKFVGVRVGIIGVGQERNALIMR